MIPDGARHFEDFDGLSYLNCAAQGPLPRVTIKAIEEAILLKAFPNRIPDQILFELPNKVRSAIAPFIGAEPEEIFLGTGESHGVAIAALGFPWKSGDEVVVAVNDFPSNIYLWTNAAERNGAKRILVQGKRHAATTDEILEAITPATRVVAVSMVDFGSGEVIDVERVSKACREREIFLAVDATQAAGILPLDVKALGISLLAGAGYKWMLSPYGTGYGYLSPEWADRIEPTYLTWTAAEGAEVFNALPRENVRWVRTARRFDAPETASFLNMSGFLQSLDFIQKIGRDAIYTHVTGLLGNLERELPSPYRRRASPSAVAGPILSIEADDTAMVHKAYRRLREAGVWVSLRDDGIRVSPYIYNQPADITKLLSLL